MLYANTDDGSSAQWVCDGNGIVVDNISIYGAERAPILEQINEHYGTSFTGWSDNEIGLRFGDPIPNWNAYEKIEMPTPPIPIGNYLVYDIDRGSLFRIAEEGIYVYAQTNEKAYIIQTDGEVIDTLNISGQNPTFAGYINSLNESLGTDYTKEDVNTIIMPNLIGTNIKNVVESYELVEVT